MLLKNANGLQNVIRKGNKTVHNKITFITVLTLCISLVSLYISQ